MDLEDLSFSAVDLAIGLNETETKIRFVFIDHSRDEALEALIGPDEAVRLTIKLIHAIARVRGYSECDA